MKHLEEFKLNENYKLITNAEIGYGYGYILMISDEPAKGKGRGITEPHLVITKSHDPNTAKKIIYQVLGHDIDIVSVKPWNNITHNCIIEK